MAEIITRRLRLRRARIEDLEALHAIFSDGIAMRYGSRLPHTDIEQTREWLGGMIALPEESSDDYIVEYGGRVIGKAGCFKLPEIGFILHPDYWGQGLASEALAAVITHMWETFSIPRIEADVDPRNEASLVLLARLGFREVGRAERTWKIGGAWCDSVYLALSRPS